MKAKQTAQLRAECTELLDGTRHHLELLKYDSVLVTGGTGFMGSWLAEYLTCANDELGLGMRVFLLADRASEFKKKAPHLARRKDVFLLRQDVRLLDEIPPEVNWIIHAAGSPDSRLHASNPVHVIQTIVQGTQATLSAAARLPNLKRFLHVSSGQVYGPQPWELEALPETYPGNVECASYMAVYPEAKRVAETWCAVFRSQWRLPLVTVRPFAFIGPYLSLDRPWAVTNFLRDSLLGGPVRIAGDGETVRSYLYGSDMASWLIALLGRGEIGCIYNVGSPHAVTVRQLAELIVRCHPVPPRIVTNVASQQSHCRSRFVPDVRRAMKLTGLNVTVDLPTAVERTLRWHSHSA
jgi:dTDP-glucose 4,6-dehydratase